MIKQCLSCPASFEAKTNHRQYCDTCKRKRRSQQAMLSRKKKNPEIELGVGSGKAKNNQPGKENHSYKTGITIYRRFVEKKECELCHSKTHLEIHHRDGDRHNNEESNLAVWCAKCHRRHHNKRCPITGQYLAK